MAAGPPATPGAARRRDGVRDVALRAGVSVGTVSNVLNHPDVVAPRTRERVQAVMAELGFVRNESARQLRAGRGRSVGLVVLDVRNPFFTDLARGAEEVAAESGLTVLLCNSDEKPEREEQHLAMLEEHRVYGVLLSPVRSGVTDVVERIRARGTPVVLVDRRAPDADHCAVAVNDVRGGHVAVAHLLDQGHRRLAFVGGPEEIPQVADRLTGARAALTERGRDRRDLRVVPTAALTVAEGRLAADVLLAVGADERPTAVFCANDLLALGLLQQVVQAGHRVPEDLAIVGYDDIDFAAAAAVPLSSVRQPRELLGRTAAQLLVEEATVAGHVHRQIEFDPELVVRVSSAHRHDPAST